MEQGRKTSGIGVIADDLTGAQDIGLMMALRGYATRVLLTPWSGTTDVPALVLEVESRGDDSHTAYQKTRTATRRALDLGRFPLYKKMSSTFQGNIGAEIDAVLDESGESFTVVVPAFPANGRLVREGILYVNGVPVAETGLQHHPTSPITDSYLPRVLAAQTQRKVALVDWRTVTRGSEALRTALDELRLDGGMVILDVTSDADLQTIAEAVRGHSVLSGGSALACALDLGEYKGEHALPDVPQGNTTATLVICGSVSEATRRQVAAAEQAGMAILTLDVDSAIRSTHDEVHTGLTQLALEAETLLRQGRDVLVRTPAEPELVRASLARGVAAGLSEQYAGQRVSAALAQLAAALIERLALTRLVVAGGDTSSAVCRTLGLTDHAIVAEVDTGVALSVASGAGSAHPMGLVLKSGNFGGTDFFLRATNALRTL